MPAVKRGRPSQGAREAAVAAGRALFAERDYDEVSTEEILARAGISRGAMYHHFPTKRDLFRAAWLACEVDAIARFLARAEPAASPFAALRDGCRAYLDEATASREVQRIGLRQSRGVLGWEDWRAALGEHVLALLRAGVQAAIDAGEVRAVDARTAANLLLALLIEAGLIIAADPDPVAARARAEPIVLALLDGLRS